MLEDALFFKSYFAEIASDTWRENKEFPVFSALQRNAKQKEIEIQFSFSLTFPYSISKYRSRVDSTILLKREKGRKR